ncbi:MAG: single-stranded DNA-binding protein [Vampirovibrionales bacterium]
MMMSLASTVLSGRLVSAVEKRYTNDNKAVSVFHLELDDRAPRATEATRVPITVWGGLAEAISTTLQPGMSILIEGRLQFNTQTMQDGRKSKQLEVVANTIQYLGQFPDGQYGFVNVQPQAQGYTQSGTTPSSPQTQNTGVTPPTTVPTPATAPTSNAPVAQATPSPDQSGGMFGYFQQDLQELEDDIPF